MHRGEIQATLVKQKLPAETSGTNGRNFLIDQIVSKIINTERMERVQINVTGKCGVGKATLVRQVYERPETQTLFEERFWLSFPPYFSVSNIMQLIYRQMDFKKIYDQLIREQSSERKKLMEKLMEDKTWSHWKKVVFLDKG
jgi:Cdc6-like AAA superfamily ATPase